MSDGYGLGEPLFDSPNSNIDIVFVHGLGGDRTGSWTWEGNGRSHSWPKDSLPQDCPTARIFSFGYNAHFAHFFPYYDPKFIPEELTIDDHSTALFQSLIGLRQRTNTDSRPIIFVCHGLGGLVCANALSRHHGADQASAALAAKTIGVVFLGTPFEGSSKSKWGIRGLNIADYLSTTHKEDMTDLEERSAKLVSINDAFQKFLKERDRSESKRFVEVACFFEVYAMYKGKIKIGLIVPKESASLPGIDSQSIQANHVDMCKFEDEEREGYKAISQRLGQWASNPDGLESVAASRQVQGSSHLGDVNYKDKIDHNRGLVMGHAYSEAPNGVKIQVGKSFVTLGIHFFR